MTRKLKVDQTSFSLEEIKQMEASEILQLVALAKSGDPEAIERVSVNTVKEAEEPLAWFITQVIEEN